MTAVIALVAGLLFGSGLLVCGMTDPANVLAFLDVGGQWSPSLPLTMAAAIAVALPAYAYARRTGRSLRGITIEVADRPHIDGALLWGSSLFGIGWGLTGVCPGPALVLVSTGTPNAVTFAVAYVIGVYAVDSLSVRGASSRRCGTASATAFF